jgi:hypothetical protein
MLGMSAPLMELISTVSSTRRRLVEWMVVRHDAVSPRSWEQILGTTLVFLPTRRSVKRSRRSRKGVGKSPTSARHIWAEVSRQTTRKVPRRGVGEVERFNGGRNVRRPSSRQSESFNVSTKAEDFELGTLRVHAFLPRIPKR